MLLGQLCTLYMYELMSEYMGCVMGMLIQPNSICHKTEDCIWREINYTCLVLLAKVFLFSLQCFT